MFGHLLGACKYSGLALRRKQGYEIGLETEILLGEYLEKKWKESGTLEKTLTGPGEGR